MAKGRRISDPTAKAAVVRKLEAGLPLTEADRVNLQCVARLDLVELVEQHYQVRAYRVVCWHCGQCSVRVFSCL